MTEEIKNAAVVEEITENVLRLKKAVEINGEKTTEIPYDLEGLSGKDLQVAQKELQKRGLVVLVNESDQNYHAAVFAVASGLSFEDLQALPAKDYNKACNLVRDFFLED